MTTALTGGGTSTLDGLSVGAGLLSLDGSGNLTVAGSFIGNQSLINNGSASTDTTLLIGQTAYIDYTSQTSLALKIATGDNQAYELTIMASGNSTAASTPPFLNPNNTTYTNFFIANFIYTNSGTLSGAALYYSALPIAYNGDVKQSKCFISTKTTSKTVAFQSTTSNSTTGAWYATGEAAWVATASTQTPSDSSVAWTSLGTISFPVASTGRVLIKRVA